jgi:hypothetical protein
MSRVAGRSSTMITGDRRASARFQGGSRGMAVAVRHMLPVRCKGTISLGGRHVPPVGVPLIGHVLFQAMKARSAAATASGCSSGAK